MNAPMRYLKASSLAEALAARGAEPGAAWLAGGTFLLAGDYREKPAYVVDVGPALPCDIARSDVALSIGAGATFQKFAEAPGVPTCLVEAALTMANRNTRNRATVGGNLGADKSCSSLIPILLALAADLEIVSPQRPVPRRLSLEAWLQGRDEFPGRAASDLIVKVHVGSASTTRAAYRRWTRSACDLSVLGVAVSYRVEEGRISELRVALGGFGPRARRSVALEEAFEGSPLPSRNEIEARAAACLSPIADLRASAEFKRLRGAQLVADALLEASSLAETLPLPPEVAS